MSRLFDPYAAKLGDLVPSDALTREQLTDARNKLRRRGLELVGRGEGWIVQVRK